MKVQQRDEAWVKTATAEEIAAAFKARELDQYMGVDLNDSGNRADDLRGIKR